MRRIILLALLLLPCAVRADQYFTTYDQAWANCQAQITQYNTISPNTYTMTCTDRPQYPDVLFQQWYKSNGAFVQFLVSRYTIPTCTAPQTYSTTTHSCQSPPAVCTAGDTKILYVLSGKLGTPAAPYEINLPKGADPTGHVNENNNGCVYTTPATNNDNTGCTVTNGGLIYCAVKATATGETTTAADTALPVETLTPMPQGQCTAPLLWDGQGCTVPQPHKNCFTVNNGEEICAPPLVKNCGQVNGVEVCMNNNALTAGGNPAAIVDGHVITDTPNQNGQQVNCALSKNAGRPVCIGLPTGDLGHVVTNLKTQPTPDNPTPRTVPVTTNVEEVSKTNTVTNTDNSKTVTTTTTTNVFNSTPTIVTQTINAAGQVTGTTTQKGDPDGSGNTKGTGTALNSTYSGKGRFYTSTGDTVSSVSTGFMDAAKNTAILKTGKEVFDVQFPQVSACASCDLSIPAVLGMNAIELLPFCASWMPTFWSFIQAALKVVTVLMAVRILITPTS
ncbi:MAG: hypothetical protein ACXV74_01865 [Methylobacter sp.]